MFKMFCLVVIIKVLFKLFLRSSDKIIVQTLSMKNIIKKTLNNKIILQKDIWGEYDKKALIHS